MEKIIIMIPVLVIVGFLGVTIGMYISSQIKCSIRKNILNNNIDKHENKSK
jgi:xanthosine utilization system XapX-like protein